MGDLRLKVRNKIYTSGNHILDTKNNNNALIVFMGSLSSEKLKSYIENFMVDTLKSQVPTNKVSYIQIDSGNFNNLTGEIESAIKKIEFNPITKNELFISFITVMDDDMYDSECFIDVSAIEKLKASTLGGYAVEFYYDFYGVFFSAAKYGNRLNSRKSILKFLDKENGGSYVRKRVYHQSCAGDDYYRSAKSITFMLLINLIEKLDHHTVLNSEAEGDCYTWTTFSLFEKNLASLVVYEIIDKLLQNQVSGIETTSSDAVTQKIKARLTEEIANMKKISSPNDLDYIPVVVKRYERKLTAGEKIHNIFSSNTIHPVEYRKINEEISVNDLLDEQKSAIDKYVSELITDEFCDSLILELVNLCTIMDSVNNTKNDALIYRCLLNIKNELLVKDTRQMDYYLLKYNEIINDAQVRIVNKVIEYYLSNINRYMVMVQSSWNKMHVEVSNLINDFASFHDYFDGIGDLIQDKTVNLLCTYDDILEKIDVNSVIQAINRNTEIYSNILASYYDNVTSAGEIAMKFGSRNIVPDLQDIAYYLFSSSPVACPGTLKLISDDYWFRDYEIAILFTAKNKMSDCNNLPYQE